MSETSDATGDSPRIVALPIFKNERGILCVAEFAPHLGFAVRRFYFMTDVPAGAVRGVHAHRTLRQAMLCLKGAATVELERRGRRWVFRLDRPDRLLLVPPGCWRVIRDFAQGAIVGVLASQEFDESDYICDYPAFVAWESEKAARDGEGDRGPQHPGAVLQPEIENLPAGLSRGRRNRGHRPFGRGVSRAPGAAPARALDPSARR